MYEFKVSIGYTAKHYLKDFVVVVGPEYRSVAEYLPSVHEAPIQTLAFRGGVLMQAFESQLAKERSMSRVMR